MSTTADKTFEERAEGDWLSRWTTFKDIVRSLTDDPEPGWRAWARTTAGVVALLLTLQFSTGLLLAFYYVPSVESAHTTVVYIEKVTPAGSWIRALHHYGSQWLTVAVVLHITQLFWRASYRRRAVGWMASVALLGLILAAGATGYSLPWDARAFFGTRITEGIAGGVPLVGDASRKWLLGGTEISAITLARFFALHVFVIPAAILTVVALRFFVLRRRATPADETKARRLSVWVRAAVVRNSIVMGAVFVALALYAARYHAPLGPPADTAAPGYLPRPGAQFLWLFQMLKYLPGRAGSIVAVALPGLMLGALAALPFLRHRPLTKVMKHPRRDVGVALFALGFALFTSMTIIAYVQDANDPRVRAQLARQHAEEEAFRAAPFTPLRVRASEGVIEDDSPAGAQPAADNAQAAASPQPQSNSNAAATTDAQASVQTDIPEAYTAQCSACHGTRGQGAKPFPRLIGITSKPRRTVEDIIALLDDPLAYNQHPPMLSYKDKLTEEEKRQIAVWIVSLKKTNR